MIGVGIGENFISSDQLALLPVTNRFMYLEEGDMHVLHVLQLKYLQMASALSVQYESLMQP